MNTQHYTAGSGKRSAEKRRGPRRSVLASRLTRAIFLSNLVGLLVLALGSLAMSRFEEGLIDAKVDMLRSHSATISSLMADSATGYGVAAKLDVESAKSILKQSSLPTAWRVRLFDGSGLLLADSAQLAGDISISTLAPITTEQEPTSWSENLKMQTRKFVQTTLHDLPWRTRRRDNLRWNLKGDVKLALGGDIVTGRRYNDKDELIVTVAQPIRRVQHVLGVMSFESNDVDGIVNAERRALAPFIALALAATLLSSLALTLFIALPMRRLARAAEEVARNPKNFDGIPDMSRRRDEIGDLSVVLNDMTAGLYRRVDDIANFAGDVAHEIKNPLTSLRSASDTLRGARTKEQREKLLDIIQNDVARMDRLISDISKASKVDANLAKETAETVDVTMILNNLASFYAQSQTRAEVIFGADPDVNEALLIRAFESPFAQVFRNLIDNALTFSPEGGKIVLCATAKEKNGRDVVVLTVEDEGPGIPEDNLEAVFDRFYTDRPKGADFGSHSGLGLAICRQIVTAHKGQIFAENKNSESDGSTGARFTITLPRQSRTDAKRK